MYTTKFNIEVLEIHALSTSCGTFYEKKKKKNFT